MRPDRRSGGPASGHSIWLSLVCKGKVEMLLRGLSFLKDRGNIREKTGKGRQGVSHNLHALLCGTGRYCPSSRKARASICSQERKLNQAGVTSLPALAHGEHREGVSASGHSRPCLVLEEEDVSAVHGCVSPGPPTEHRFRTRETRIASQSHSLPCVPYNHPCK